MLTLTEAPDQERLTFPRECTPQMPARSSFHVRTGGGHGRALRPSTTSDGMLAGRPPVFSFLEVLTVFQAMAGRACPVQRAPLCAILKWNQ